MHAQLYSNIEIYSNCKNESAKKAEATPTEWLVYGEVSLDKEHRCASHLTLLKDVATFPVQHSIDSTNSILRALQQHQHSVDAVYTHPLHHIYRQYLTHISSDANICRPVSNRVEICQLQWNISWPKHV